MKREHSAIARQPKTDTAHCRYGHELTASNSYARPTGPKLGCLACRRKQSQEAYQRRLLRQLDLARAERSRNKGVVATAAT